MTAQLLDRQEAARLLKIHVKTLQKMARIKEVPAIRIGALWRFVASELDTWLNSKICSNPPLVS
jgi:excisionase family DNA binding protein